MRKSFFNTMRVLSFFKNRIMQKRLTFFFIAFSICLANGWGQTRTISVSPSFLYFVAEGGEQTFNITSNTDWTISSNQDWCTVFPTSGSNNETITVRVTAATRNQNPQNATITISGVGIIQRVSIQQSGISTNVRTWEITPTMTATFTERNRVLTISTTKDSEAMPDFSFAKLSPWSKTARSVIIEDNITSIGDLAFYQCVDLYSISIPNSVTSIGSYAFAECRTLSSISLPNSVKTIGSYAFYRFRDISSITIPNSVTSIGSFAFRECNDLAAITVPGSITELGERVFGSCNNLTSVTIQEGALVIGRGMFYGCGNLKSVSIPGTVQIIGAESFYGCGNLTSLVISEGVTGIDIDAFNSCTALETVVLPNTMEVIATRVFSGCNKLTTVNFPENLKLIGNYAFMRCYGLTSINIPKSVEVIYPEAFRYCENLEYVSVAAHIIGERAFGNCLKLKTIIIKDGVSEIANVAFEGSETVETVVDIAPSVTKILSGAFSRNMKEIYVYWQEPIAINNYLAFPFGMAHIATLYVPKGTIEAYKSSNWGYINNIIEMGDPPTTDFEVENGVLIKYNGQGGNIVIPDNLGITTIGNFAFAHCENLTSVTIPPSVITIGEGAFAGCIGLTAITIPNSVKSIGAMAFSGSGIAAITFPASVESFGSCVFNGQVLDPRVTVSSLDITVGWQTAQQLPSDFPACNITSWLHVPSGTKSIYQSNSLWGNGGRIVEYEASGKSLAVLDNLYNPLSSLNFTALGEQKTFSIASNSDWTANSSDASWLKVSHTSGTNTYDWSNSPNKGPITVTADPNTTSSARTATITVSGAGVTTKTISVTQAAGQGGGEEPNGVLTATPVTSLPENYRDKQYLLAVTGIDMASSGVPQTFKTLSSGSDTYVMFVDNITNDKAFLRIENLADLGTDYGFLYNGQPDYQSGALQRALWKLDIGSSGPGSTVIFDFQNLATNSLLKVPNHTGTEQYWTKDGNNNWTFKGVSADQNLKGGKLDNLDASYQINHWYFSQTVVQPLQRNMPLYTYVTLDTLQILVLDEETTAFRDPATGLARSGGFTVTVKRVSIYDLIMQNISNVLHFTLMQAETGTNNRVVPEETKPINSDGKGNIALSMSIPSNTTIQGSFEVRFPAGISLDEESSALADELSGGFSLSSTSMADNTWLIEINPKALKSAELTTEYRKIMDIAYKITENVPDGEYQTQILNLYFELDDGTTIQEDLITVSLRVEQNPTSNENIHNRPIKVYFAGNLLRIESPQAESIKIYSTMGMQVYSTDKPSGMIEIPFTSQPGSVYFIKGSISGTTKVIK